MPSHMSELAALMLGLSNHTTYAKTIFNSYSVEKRFPAEITG